jgi:serine/threonine protein kinase
LTTNRFLKGSEIGIGGRGRVYRGFDTWLDRDVALKVLRDEFAADPTENRRFELEAKYLAKLDHENIVRVYDRVELDGRLAMVMEFVHGTSLERRIDPRRSRQREGDWKRSIRAKGLSVRESVNFASQIASALSSAHALGLIHRDVKPGNIMITPDNRVKVLDFGLSKLSPTSLSHLRDTSATATMLTPLGSILGTLPYMPPERLQGQIATAQSDQFSFAVVVFEMFTGQRPFSGSAPDLIKAILSDHPNWPNSFSDNWPELVQVVNRGLSKDPRDRYPSVLAFSAALERAWNASADSPKRRTIPLWMAGAAVIASALVVVVGMSGTKPIPRIQPTLPLGAQVMSFHAQPVLQLDQADLIDSPSLPLGGGPVFASHESGYWHVVRQVARGLKPYDLMPILHCDSTQPALSPDGFLIAFRSECGGGGLFVVESGSVNGKWQRVAERGSYPAWSPDSHELSYSGPNGLYSVRIGGEPRLVQPGDIYQSSWSPNGKRIAYVNFVNGQHDIFTVSPGETPTRVTNDSAINVQPVWNRATNRLYYLSNKTGRRAIWSVAISESIGLVDGVPHLEELGRGRDIASFSISAEGTFIFVEQAGSSTIEKAFLSHGEVSLESGPIRVAEVPDISPAGIDLSWLNSLAVYSSEPEKNIILYDVVRNQGKKLIADGYTNRHPKISHDGKFVAYDSLRKGTSQIYVVDLLTGKSEQVSSETSSGANNPVWSSDGHKLAFSLSNGGSGIVDLRPPQQARKIVNFPSLRGEPGCFFVPSSFSNDGKSVAGFSLCRNGLSQGVRLYDLQGGDYQRISTFGRSPDFIDAGAVGFTDRVALFYAQASPNAKARQLYSLAPDIFAPGFSVSPDGHELLYMRFKPRSYLFTQSTQSFGVTGEILTPR